jgi:hypothetical protein
MVLKRADTWVRPYRENTGPLKTRASYSPLF